MDRRSFLASGAATIGTALSGCLGTTERGYDVAMISMGFVPGTTIDVPADAPRWIPEDAPTMEVDVGETIIWENTGSRIHTVTAATTAHRRIERRLVTEGRPSVEHDGAVPRLPPGANFFSSGSFDTEFEAVNSFRTELSGGGAIPPGVRYAHTFHEPGWYHYYCIPHETAGMYANVLVE